MVDNVAQATLIKEISSRLMHSWSLARHHHKRLQHKKLNHISQRVTISRMTEAPQFKKVVTSAVCLIPDNDIWAPIQEIRKVHDKSYYRWMPHINLLYPFAPHNELPDIVNHVKHAIEGMSPFSVTYSSFRFFKHSNRSFTMWLQPEPEQAVKELQLKLWQAFPHCDEQNTKNDEKEFIPHLSVGQWSSMSSLESAMKTFQERWKPISHQVSGVYIITRLNDEPFDVRYFVGFNGEVIKKNFEPQRQRDLNATLHVRNLSYDVTADELKSAVEEKGFTVVEANIAYDRSHKSRGFGFVELSSPAEMHRAAATIPSIHLRGRTAYLSPARAKE